MILVVNCGMPDNGTNTNRIGSEYIYRKNVTDGCILGYEVQSGDEIRTCQANGSWTGTPLICSSKYCIFPL